MSIRNFVLVGLVALCVAGAASPEKTDASAARFQRELDLIQRQSDSPGPYQPATLTADDATAWFAGPGAAHLPPGVSQLRITAEAGTIGGSAQIDFDRIEAHAPVNPLVGALFSGRHAVSAQAHLDSVSDGVAHLTVTSVAIDGQTVPNLLVDAAIRAFIQPRHPDISRNFAISLPAHVTGMQLGDGWMKLEYSPRPSAL